MVRVHVDKSIKQLKKNFDNLNKDQIARASYSAINRTLTKGRTLARQAVKSEYNIPQKNLEGINKKNATRSLLIGYILASAKPVPMDAFAAKYEAPKKTISITRKGAQKVTNRKKERRNAAGLTIEVHRQKRLPVERAFMIEGAKPRVFARGEYRGGGGTYGFVHRKSRVNRRGSDVPIKPLLSVSVHGAVINNKVESNIAKEVEPFFNKRLQHELNYQLSKMRDQTL